MVNHFKALAPPSSMPFLGTVLVQESECPYFEDRRPTQIAVSAPGRLSTEQFEQSLLNGMRRSGALMYRPVCNACRKCLPLRVPVSSFVPTKSQERVFKRCDSLFTANFSDSVATDENVELYRRYQAYKHGDVLSAEDAYDVYERFLVETCAETREMSWRTKGGKLVGVGILDIAQSGVSSVYFYWDPDFASYGLGTFSILKEIELCKQLGLSHYYLGYYVPGSRAMEYKSHFGPNEIWNGGGFEPFASEQIAELESKCMIADEKSFDLKLSYDFESLKEGIEE